MITSNFLGGIKSIANEKQNEARKAIRICKGKHGDYLRE